MELARHGLRVVIRAALLLLAGGRQPLPDPRQGCRRAPTPRSPSGRRATPSACPPSTRGWTARSTFSAPPCSRRRPSPTAACATSSAGFGLAMEARKLGLQGQSDLLDLFAKSAGDILDQLVRDRCAQGPARLRRHHRQLCLALHPGQRLRAPPPRLRRGERRARAPGVTRSAAWAPSPRRWPRPAARPGWRSTTDAPVREVSVNGGRAVGVVLEDGTDIAAKDGRLQRHPENPVRLAGRPADACRRTFRERIAGWRVGSGTFRMNVALSELPSFTCKPSTGVAEQHGASIVIAPSLGYLDQAYMDARQHGWARKLGDRDAHPQRARRQPRPSGRPRRQPLLPAGRADDAGRLLLGRSPRRSGRPRHRHGRRPRAQLQSVSVLGRMILSPARSGAEAQPDRRRHLPWRPFAGPAVGGAPGAGLRRLPLSDRRPLHVRVVAPTPAAGLPEPRATTPRTRSCATWARAGGGGPMITAIDHVALAVRDLDSAIDGYRKLLGREPNWLGGDGGARHAWFQLSNMALDVITPHGDGAFGDVMRRHLDETGEGVWAIAFTVRNAAEAQALVTRRGLRATEPHPTRSTHDDGRKRYWTTSLGRSRDTAGVQVLLVDPPRSGEPWPASPFIADPGAAIDELDHVVIRTSHPERAVANFGGRLGLDLRLDRATKPGARASCSSAAARRWWSSPTSLKETAPSDVDRVNGLAWRATDAEAARARIAAAGLDVSEVRGGPQARIARLHRSLGRGRGARPRHRAGIADLSLRWADSATVVGADPLHQHPAVARRGGDFRRPRTDRPFRIDELVADRDGVVVQRPQVGDPKGRAKVGIEAVDRRRRKRAAMPLLGHHQRRRALAVRLTESGVEVARRLGGLLRRRLIRVVRAGVRRRTPGLDRRERGLGGVAITWPSVRDGRAPARSAASPGRTATPARPVLAEETGRGAGAARREAAPAPGARSGRRDVFGRIDHLGRPSGNHHRIGGRAVEPHIQPSARHAVARRAVG